MRNSTRIKRYVVHRITVSQDFITLLLLLFVIIIIIIIIEHPFDCGTD